MGLTFFAMETILPLSNSRFLQVNHVTSSQCKHNWMFTIPVLATDKQTTSKEHQLLFTEYFRVVKKLSVFTCFTMTSAIPPTVLPPFPITRPAAEEGTLMWASSFTSSFGLKKFSSFSFPNIRPWACNIKIRLQWKIYEPVTIHSCVHS